jgi:hypothetical protein
MAPCTENLRLLIPADIPTASTLLADWRAQRNMLQSELESDDMDTPVPFDIDAILAQLDELEQHITGDCIPAAKAAFQRVFESVALYWQDVSPRRRELVRAEIIPRFPFCLPENTLRPVKSQPAIKRLQTHQNCLRSTVGR